MLVTKIGGSIASEAAPVLDELAGTEPGDALLVHGFGPQTTRRAEEADHETRWLRSPQGVRSRFTDEATLALMEQAATDVAGTLADGLAERGIPHRWIAGQEGLLRAEAKPALRHERDDGRVVLVRGNRSGRVADVDARPVERTLDRGQLPVLTPLARDEEGLVSVDADRAAAAIAGELDAEGLVLLTDVERVRDEHGEPIDELPVEAVAELRRAEALSGGMLRKLLAAREALEAGVGRVLVADGTRPRPIERAREGEATEVIA